MGYRGEGMGNNPNSPTWPPPANLQFFAVDPDRLPLYIGHYQY